jgi:hypothetical protein
MPMPSPLKVLFIAGSGRSGSTILSTVLGHLEGFVSIGELTHLWVGILENRPCGCAESFPRCPFWSRVLEPDLLDRRNVERVLSAKQRLIRQRILGRLDVWRGNRDAFDDAADGYAVVLGDVYRRVRRITGCRVIVDSSHQPAHGYAVQRIPDVETFVLHVVRDSRAVAFSKTRLKPRMPEGWTHDEFMERFDTATSGRDWMAVNLKTEYFWGIRPGSTNFLRMRYEDFARAPRTAVADLLRFLEEERDLDVFLDDHTARLDRPTHHVEGNPVRFRGGETEIRLDDEWSTTMSRWSRLAILGLTWPLLLRYGYPLGGRGRPERSTATGPVEARVSGRD